jgi:ABC-2 type transport system ATP-binding protein
MIELQALTRRFGSFTAVDGISLSIGRGEVLGFLGPNGAGKSTTMKMAAGFLHPTAGTAVICGADIVDRPLVARRHLGYLPEGAPAYPDMTPLGFLRFVARVRGLSGALAKRRLGWVIDRLQLGTVLYQPIETLSKGYKRRVGLAQALIHDPDVLILDEPTDGLDPNQKFEMRGLIREIAADKAIIVSTHILEEVDAVCTRAVVIARGRVLADETPAGLAARSRLANAVFMRLDGAIDAAFIDALSAHPEVAAVDRDGPDILTVVSRHRRPILAEVSAMAQAYRIPVVEMKVEQGRLDEVFRDITLGASAAKTAA